MACARRLAMAGLETVVIEAERHYGRGISSRNSEVIHAGLYYKPGSLKARLCREGRDQLYAYCLERNIPHRQLGKWIVACSAAQVSGLEKIAARAEENGCTEVRMISGEEARRLEPQLRAEKVLESPRTGIVDSHALMTALLADTEKAGGVLVLDAPVLGGDMGADIICLQVGGKEPASLVAGVVINAAGLSAPALARNFFGLPQSASPRSAFAKGSYFSLSGRSPFSRLVYPVPEVGGLGIHLTLDLQGHARFGPDVEWVDQPSYGVDSAKAANFCAAIQTYWPDCPLERLAPAYAGVRPKLGCREDFFEDFMIQGPLDHGRAGLVNLFGIESPGLTSCFSIADEVAIRLGIH
nr:NAD(P)/FAD-dependent oxidoreductase [Rhodocyclus gracilis]